jgi:mono/diheme cytochrome c family protein
MVSRLAPFLVMGAALVTFSGLWAWHRDAQASRASLIRIEASQGQHLFHAMCETCHGPDGDGAGGAPNLMNGEVLQQYPTVSQLATFIQERMPATNPGILTNSEARDLALWIQALNPRLTP